MFVHSSHFVRGDWRLNFSKLLQLLEVIIVLRCRRSVRTVTRAQSWRAKNSKIYEMWQRSYEHNAVHAKGTVSRLVLEDLRKRAGVWKHRRECKYAGCALCKVLKVILAILKLILYSTGSRYVKLLKKRVWIGLEGIKHDTRQEILRKFGNVFQSIVP